MAQWSFKFEGGKELAKKLNNLAKKSKTIFNTASRETMKRIRTAIAAAAPMDIGTLKLAMAKAPIRNVKGRGIAGTGIKMPDRATLGIPAEATGYYPYAVEYGTSRQPPQKFIRGTVDAMSETEFRLLAKAIARGIDRVVK